MPLIRLYGGFVSGVIAYLLLADAAAQNAVVVAFVLVAVAFIPAAVHSKSFKPDLLRGGLIYVTLVLAGFIMAYQHNQMLRKHHFSHFQEGEGFLLVQVIEPVSERANSFRAIVSVLAVKNDSLTQRVEGKLMLYFQKDSMAAALHYGDQIMIHNRFDAVDAPKNPNVFDYRRFLSRQNIFHSSYIRSGTWRHTGNNSGRSFIRLALHIRNNALKTFSDNNMSGREFAVISALLLGYREYLDEDLRREFAGAGAMHILCVSGLHVGIIFMVLKNIFSFLTRLPGGIYLRTLAIILFIWLYAAITGFSPSVLRASVMFSFVSVGQSFRRPTNIYNTLAASAFVLTLANPYIITQIGFQLSYLAVISIVALQPPLYGLFRIKNKILDKCWSIITVSIAAQLATGPLALFYFNQFPNYFLITNLVVIPLASIIIYAGLITLVVAPVPFVSAFAGKALSIVVSLLHHSVRFIEGLPYSTTTGLFISFPETMLVFLIIFGSVFFLMKDNREAFVATLMLILLLVFSVSWRGTSNAGQHHFVVYHTNRGTAVDFFSGNNLLMLACDNMVDDVRGQQFAMAGFRMRKGHNHPDLVVALEKSDTLTVFPYWAKGGDFILFGDEKILLIHSSEQVQRYARLNEPVAVDYLLLVQNPRIEMEDILICVKPRKVLIDASNSAWNAARWEQACKEAGVKVWNVRSNGAYQSS